jgi:hypothetical protein
MTMRPLKSIIALATLALVAAGISQVAAHHSGSMFDSSKNQTIRGKVVEMRWVNPHVTITVNASASPGEAQAEWLMETTSPGNLTRGGWRRDVIKPGDEIEVTFNPLREADKKSGRLREMKVLSTGEVFPVDIRDQERPGLE